MDRGRRRIRRQQPLHLHDRLGFKVSADKVNAVIAEAGTYDYWLLPEAGRAT